MGICNFEISLRCIDHHNARSCRYFSFLFLKATRVFAFLYPANSKIPHDYFNLNIYVDRIRKFNLQRGLTDGLFFTDLFGSNACLLSVMATPDALGANPTAIAKSWGEPRHSWARSHCRKSDAKSATRSTALLGDKAIEERFCSKCSFSLSWRLHRSIKSFSPVVEDPGQEVVFFFAKKCKSTNSPASVTETTANTLKWNRLSLKYFQRVFFSNEIKMIQSKVYNFESPLWNNDAPDSTTSSTFNVRGEAEL